MKDNKVKLVELTDKGMLNISAGSFFGTLGYYAGRALGAFVRAQEREFDSNIGGPTAIHG